MYDQDVYVCKLEPNGFRLSILAQALQLSDQSQHFLFFSIVCSFLVVVLAVDDEDPSVLCRLVLGGERSLFAYCRFQFPVGASSFWSRSD